MKRYIFRVFIISVNGKGFLLMYDYSYVKNFLFAFALILAIIHYALFKSYDRSDIIVE